MAGEHILIVEDENKIALLLQDYLVNYGFKTSIIDNGEDVEPFVKSSSMDLILLDINLPKLDGLSVCKNIRQFSSIPIIFITARVEEIDALLGLELGSDDYIRKPFRPREVVARVKAVLRRGKGPDIESGNESSNESSGEFSGDLDVDTGKKLGVLTLREEAHIIMVNGKELDLTPNEFGILKTFIHRPGKVFTRSELVDMVQGYNFDGYERTIDTHIKNLRKKLALVLPGKEVIKSIYGVGYKLNEINLKQTPSS
jgi:two-component system response regulator BaeR